MPALARADPCPMATNLDSLMTHLADIDGRERRITEEHVRVIAEVRAIKAAAASADGSVPPARSGRGRGAWLGTSQAARAFRLRRAR